MVNLDFFRMQEYNKTYFQVISGKNLRKNAERKYDGLQDLQRIVGSISEARRKRLKGFMDVPIPNRSTFLDVPIAFRIAKLLFGYYQRLGEIEQTIFMLEYCTVFDTIIIEHLDDNEGSRYASMAEQYLPKFDGMKDTRYCGYICGLLHLDEIRQKIAEILDRKRKEIYYNSYMSLEE